MLMLMKCNALKEAKHLGCYSAKREPASTKEQIAALKRGSIVV
jgi:hypothetical protein